MMKRAMFITSCVMGLLVFAVPAAAGVTPQGTAFTYQGKLTSGGSPVTTATDFKFRLFDTETLGTQIGLELTAGNLDLNDDGTFIVDLDFGAAAFLGDERWLEVDVRSPHDPGDTNPYTTLAPRQLIMTVPYAQFALSAPGPWTQQSGQVLTNDDVGIGTKPAQRLHVSGNQVNPPTILLQSADAPSGAQAAAVFVDPVSGDFGLGRMSDDGAALTRTDLTIDADTGRVGIGTSNPAVRLDVAGNCKVGGTLEVGSAPPPVPVTVQFAGVFSGAEYGVIAFGADTFGAAGLIGQGYAGVKGFATSMNGGGVEGFTDQEGSGVYGNGGSFGSGVIGVGENGVVGESTSPTGIGVYGLASASTGNARGGYFQSDSTSGIGVVGEATGYGKTIGVWGVVNMIDSAQLAVLASGNMAASGTKSFRIDHPDDPANKYLLHYAAESPEVINFYRGTVMLDGAGEAVVELPHYFARINKTPSYQLTAVGAPMPMLHVAEEIDEAALIVGAAAGPGVPAPLCWFRIAGGVPGAKVSWRVEAVRNDRWVQKRGAPVELDKQDLEKGTYQQPELYGQPREMAVHYLPEHGRVAR